MKPTKEEVEGVVNELKLAMLESIDADCKEDIAKLKKTKAHHRLLLARDEVRALRFN